MRLPKRARAQVPAKSRNSSSNPTRGRRSNSNKTARYSAATRLALPPPPTMKGAEAPPMDRSPPDTPMDRSPPDAQAARRRPTHVVERKLGELDACLAKALTSGPRRSDVDGSLFMDIHARTDFLRTLIATERVSHGGALPGHLVEAEERFGALERTFEQWLQSGIAAPAEEEEEPARAAAGSWSGSESGGCSCTGSCFGFEVTGQEAAFDAKCNLDQDDAEERKDKEAAAAAIEVAPATRTTAPRRWWKRRAALCGAAVVVAVVALGAGLALEFAAVSQQSVSLVPT